MKSWKFCLCLVGFSVIAVVVFCNEKVTTFVSQQIFDDLLTIEIFLSEKPLPSSVQCAYGCLSVINCKSFIYNEGNDDCKLVSRVIENTINSTSSTGMRYFVEAAKRCSKQLNIYGSNITLYEDKEVGSVIAYTCAVGFVSNTGGGTVTCLVNGSWSTPTDPCTECGLYSLNAFFMRPGKLFNPPASVFGNLSFHVSSFSYCKLLCGLGHNCLAVYLNLTDNSCFSAPVRAEENFPEYGPYYIDDSAFEEYIKLCL